MRRSDGSATTDDPSKKSAGGPGGRLRIMSTTAEPLRQRRASHRVVLRTVVDRDPPLALVVRHTHVHGAAAGPAVAVGHREADVIHAAVTRRPRRARALRADLRRGGAEARAVYRRVAVTLRVGRLVLRDA